MGVLAIVVAMSAMLAEERRQQRRDRYADRSTGLAQVRELAGAMRRRLMMMAALVCGVLALTDFAAHWGRQRNPLAHFHCRCLPGWWRRVTRCSTPPARHATV